MPMASNLVNQKVSKMWLGFQSFAFSIWYTIHVLSKADHVIELTTSYW